jgi:glycosyltransferase involved in cell wall biosynthesis
MGWAADVKQVMKSARVCLAPLRFGAGIKGKLADAMRYGTPSVTTSIGAEAMSGDLPWGGSIEDDLQKFAVAAVRLYQSSEEWQQAQAHGFEIVRQLFNKQQHAAALVSRINNHQQNMEAYRLNNFTGAMLRHHHHSSTQYMSRWIEAKNRLEMMTGKQSEEK